MLARFRWYRIQLPKSVIDLSNLLKSRPFSQNADFGFLSVEGLMGEEIFRFLLRTKIPIPQYHGDGNSVYREVDSVSVTDFSILKVEEVFFIRVENPGRNIRDLLNAIEMLVGLGFTSRPVTFEKKTPERVLELADSSKLIGLKIVGAVVGEDVVARMEFASKGGIDINKLETLNDVKYKVESASYDLIFEGLRGHLTFTSSGLVRVTDHFAALLINLIEAELPSML